MCYELALQIQFWQSGVNFTISSVMASLDMVRWHRLSSNGMLRWSRQHYVYRQSQIQGSIWRPSVMPKDFQGFLHSCQGNAKIVPKIKMWSPPATLFQIH